jgi:hypothetical protein
MTELLEEKIIETLKNVNEEELDTLQISRLVLGKGSTQKQINPTLYKLLKEGKIERITKEGEARPRWKLSKI